eukprot:8983760-Alexandrium_andersonii.AAC.1
MWRARHGGVGFSWAFVRSLRELACVSSTAALLQPMLSLPRWVSHTRDGLPVCGCGLGFARLA